MPARAKILISEDVTGTGIETLKKKYEVVYDPDLWKKVPELEQAVEEVDALIIRNQTKITPTLVNKAKNLKIIGRAGAGYDNIDVPSVSLAGVVVSFSPEENAVSVAEHVFALLLSLARKTPGADRSTKNGGWERKKYHGFELLGKTLGIFGLGKIGVRVALRAKAFGMRHSRPRRLSLLHQPSCHRIRRRACFRGPAPGGVRFSDRPPSPNQGNAGNSERAAFRKMKPTAFLINTSRGEVIAEADLAQALKEGRLAGAALDVREKEPPEKESPLHGMDNVILTPHTAGLTYEAQEKVVAAVAEDVDRVLSGLPALRFVNFGLPKK